MREGQLTAAAKRTVAVLAIVLGLGVCTPAFGLEVRRYDERVTLFRNGTAAIQLSLTLAEPPGSSVLIPLGYATIQNLKGRGSDPVSVREVGSQGNHFVAVTLPASGQGGATVEISFQVADYLKNSGSPGPHGNLDFYYRFVNVTFSRIAEFTAGITLPDGYVLGTIGDFVPQPKKSGMTAPYVLSRVAGQDVVAISLSDLKLGDEVKLNGTFKNTRKSKILLFSLIALAIGSLFFFRDTLKNGKSDAGTKP